ncbi:MAG: deoxyribonuclease IV, partial [Thermodesulfobacteriota bacterium]|nr:deoxyribonuclease IV [Thermodesulfobacteriota bacterium]
RKIAQKRAIDSLSRVMGRGKWGAGLLLENTAGERGDISSTIEDLAEILGGVNSVGISGICFDTCHGFSAGYDLRRPETIDSLLDKIERYIGFDKVKLIHFNDSKRDLGARVDRHEHIGKGKIGIKGFQIFFGREEIRSIPLILETPKKSLEDDKQNLAVARKILSGISKDSQKVKQNS